MQIVIDIDDDMYKSVVNNDAYVLGDADWILLENAIANGVPLPEHGRLIDKSAMLIEGSRLKGEWRTYYSPGSTVRCSNCWKSFRTEWNFCPNEALEQDPILDTRQRERQLEIEYQHGYDKGWEEGRKALEQQPCDDCVSRTDVLKVMCETCPVYDCITGCQSYRSIEKMPPATPKAEWIPCSEKLPEESGDYLVCPSKNILNDYPNFSEVMIMPYDEGSEAFGWWEDHYDPKTLGFLDSDFYEFEVIAWRPLPESYRGDTDERN